MMKTNDDDFKEYKQSLSVLRSFGLTDGGTVRKYMSEYPSVVEVIYDRFKDVCLFEMEEMKTNPIRYIKDYRKHYFHRDMVFRLEECLIPNLLDDIRWDLRNTRNTRDYIVKTR